MQITSSKNPRVQRTARLRQSRDRAKSGLFLIDGLREASRAADMGVEFVEVYHRDLSEISSIAAEWILQTQEEFGDRVEWLEVSEHAFQKLAYGDRDDGLVVVAKQQHIELNDVELERDRVPLVFIAERLEKPGNLGAILRTADATGVDLLLLVDTTVDTTNPNVIRASMGTAFTVPVVRTTAECAKQWCLAQGIQILATRLDASKNYHDVDLTVPTAIVLGSEAEGLSEQWCDSDLMPIILPMEGITDSLNVSVTAGVLAYEAKRQRQLPPGQLSFEAAIIIGLWLFP